MNTKNLQKRGIFLPTLFTLFLLFCISLFFWLGLLVFMTGCRRLPDAADPSKTSDDLMDIPVDAAANASSLQTALAEQVLRLHIIADSNSDADQTVKLAVRDAVITYLAPYLDGVTTKQEAMEIIGAQLVPLADTANRVLAENGFSYTADASLGRAYFPIRLYGDLTLPAGEYDALKIRLGSASGKNWWCLVFPQLCFVDVTTGTLPEDTKEELRELLTEEEYALVFSESTLNDRIAASIELSGQTCRLLFDHAPRQTQKTKIRFPLLEQLKKLFSP